MRCLSAREFAHMPLLSKRFPGGKITAYYEMINLFQRPHCYRLTTNLIVQLVILDRIKTKKWRLSEAVGNEDGAVLKAVKLTDAKDASISTVEFLHFDSGIEMIKNRHKLPSDIFIDDTEFNAEMDTQMFEPRNLQ